ncbi:MAG: VRR-NUC domain-containing protein [Acidobacteriaceae bacterium]
MRQSALPVPTEDQEQRVVVQWLTLMRVRFTHPANEGTKSAVRGAIMKGLGLVPGVPDLLIFDPPPAVSGAVGAAIELKRRRGGVVSDAQKEWLEALAERGWQVAVCHGADEAIATLEAWGYGRGRG